MANELYEFTTLFGNNDTVKPLIDIIEQIINLPDENLNEVTVNVISGMIKGAFTEEVRQKAIENIVANFREDGYDKALVHTVIESVKNRMDELLNGLTVSQEKMAILKEIFNIFYSVFDEAENAFNVYDITLPILLDAGAVMPAYSHVSDAAADLASLETITIPAHTLSNKVKTGVHLQLPEGWQARLVPRSSIGAKTPLRLSNAMGIIDTAYTGDVTVLFDNISDSDYTISAGDRIAQLWVEPVYHFRGQQVTELIPTERNDAGFGSTGV